MMNPIDVIVTSYARFDLLERTLDSFFRFNTAPINKVYVYDDFGMLNLSKDQKTILSAMVEKYKDQATFLSKPKRIGQIKALDELHKHITTDWYFNIEDDFTFFRSGFIEESYQIMQGRDNCIQVHLRDRTDLNGHPVFKYLDGTYHLRTGYRSIWHGFSFNPSLRRISDYKKLGTYSKVAAFNPKRPYEAEAAIGKQYFKLGYYAGVTESGYCLHAGDGRGIRK